MYNVNVQLPPEIVSSGSMLYVHFKTDDTIFGKGFAAVYMQVDSAVMAPTGAQLPPDSQTNNAEYFETRTVRRGKPPSTTTKKFPSHRHQRRHQHHRQQHLSTKTSRFVT